MQRLWKSITFGIAFTTVMLISNSASSSNNLPRWAGFVIRFLVAVIVYYLVAFAADYFLAKRNKGKHEEK